MRTKTGARLRVILAILAVEKQTFTGITYSTS